MPNRQQAITWTNDSIVYWRICVTWTLLHVQHYLEGNSLKEHDDIHGNCVISYFIMTHSAIDASMFNPSPSGQNGHYWTDDFFPEWFFLFWLKFHWNLFLRFQLTITQHWLGAEKMASHYLNQGRPDWMTHICDTRGLWVKWRMTCNYLFSTESFTDRD